MLSCKGEVSLLQSKLKKFDILIINLADGPSLGVEEPASVFLSLSNLKQKMLNQHLGKIKTFGSIISMPGFVKQSFP